MIPSSNFISSPSNILLHVYPPHNTHTPHSLDNSVSSNHDTCDYREQINTNDNNKIRIHGKNKQKPNTPTPYNTKMELNSIQQGAKTFTSCKRNNILQNQSIAANDKKQLLNLNKIRKRKTC